MASLDWQIKVDDIIASVQGGKGMVQAVDQAPIVGSTMSRLMLYMEHGTMYSTPGHAVQYHAVCDSVQ